MYNPIKTFLPSKALQPFVVSYNFIAENNKSTHTNKADYPRTALDMVFTFDGAVSIRGQNNLELKLSNYALVGLFDKKYEISFSNKISALHIRFQPNGIYPLTDISLNETSSNQISLEQLIGKDIVQLYNDIGNELCLTKKIAILEKFLIAKYNASSPHYKFNHCLNEISKNNSNLTVSELAAVTNTNYKSLDRWFKKYVGTTPKKYLQLNRFKNILARIEKEKASDWMDYVVDFGFHDHAHFIHQFKSIAGVTPQSYFKKSDSFYRS